MTLRARLCCQHHSFDALSVTNPLRSRGGEMLPVRRMQSRQKFAAVPSSGYDHVNEESGLSIRQIFKRSVANALAELRQPRAA